MMRYRRTRKSDLYLRHFLDNLTFDDDDMIQQAKTLIHSTDIKPILNLIASLFMIPQEIINRKRNPTRLDLETLFGKQTTEKHKIAKEIFKYCVRNYPNSLSLKLTRTILSSTQRPVTRTLSIILLHSLVSSLDSLCPIILTQIKPRLISCLEQPNTWSMFKTLSRIVSKIASQVFNIEDDGNREWAELFEYIDSSFGSDYEKGMLVFRDLPMNVTGEFVPFFTNFRENALLGLKSRNTKVWALGFVASVRLLMCLVGRYEYDSMVVRRAIIGSVIELVRAKREKCVRKGICDWRFVVGEEGTSYSMVEIQFVYRFVMNLTNVQGIEAETRFAALDILTKLEKVRFSE